MTDDLKELVRSVRALARRADVCSRKLAQHRIASVRNTDATGGRVALVQLAQAARDFHNAVEAAFAALSDDIKKSMI
jgi:hypothetical protein